MLNENKPATRRQILYDSPCEVLKLVKSIGIKNKNGGRQGLRRRSGELGDGGELKF